MTDYALNANGDPGGVDGRAVGDPGSNATNDIYNTPNLTSNNPTTRRGAVLADNQPALQRGYMRAWQSDQNYRLDFQFNPAELGQRIQTNMDSSAPQPTLQADDQKTLPNTMSEFTFALRFDRQGDVAAKRGSDGVLTDINMMYVICQVINGVTIQQPVVDVVFGPRLMVRGYITIVNVDYIKFDVRMVPTICTVQINMTMNYFGVQTSALPLPPASWTANTPTSAAEDNSIGVGLGLIGSPNNPLIGSSTDTSNRYIQGAFPNGVNSPIRTGF